MSNSTLITCEKINNFDLTKLWKNSKNGYWYCKVDGKIQSLHRLLAETFLPNPNNYGDVNHKDGNRDNNTLDNLEWCTRSYNLKHSYDSNGRVGATTGKFGDQHHRSIAILATCLVTGKIQRYASMNEAGREGFNIPSISRCVNNIRRSHKGFKWERQKKSEG